MALRRDSLCPQRAAHGGILPPPPRGISDCDRQDPRRLGHGSCHHHASPGTDTFFSRVKSHQGVPTRAPRIPRILHRDDLDVSVPRVQSPKDETASSSCPIRKTPMSSPGKHHIFGPQSRFNQPFFGIGPLTHVDLNDTYVNTKLHK